MKMRVKERRISDFIFFPKFQFIEMLLVIKNDLLVVFFTLRVWNLYTYCKIWYVENWFLREILKGLVFVKGFVWFFSVIREKTFH